MPRSVVGIIRRREFTDDFIELIGLDNTGLLMEVDNTFLIRAHSRSVGTVRDYFRFIKPLPFLSSGLPTTQIAAHARSFASCS